MIAALLFYKIVPMEKYMHRQNKLKHDLLLIYCHWMFSSLSLFLNSAEWKNCDKG